VRDRARRGSVDRESAGRGNRARRSQYGHRNKLEYSFTQTEDGAGARHFHRAGRWDEVLPIEVCLLTTELSNAIRDAVQVGA
jgi:tRNA/tmRNA/rRNA uracil-C5-methylase (TrmA/RlmC/RlmD family)